MACVADLSSGVPFTWLIGLRDAFVVLFPQLISEKKQQHNALWKRAILQACVLG